MFRAGKPLSRENAQPLGDLAETLGRLLRNTVFRLSLIGAFLFGVSLLIAQAIVYYQIVQSERIRVEEALQNEFLDVITLFSRNGEAAVQQAIREGVLPSDQTLFSEDDRKRAKIIYDTAAGGAVYRIVNARDSLLQENYGMFVFQGAVIGKLLTETTFADIEVNGIDSKYLAEYARSDDKLIRFATVSEVADPETGEIEERRLIVVGQNITQNGERVGLLLLGRDIENILQTGERMSEAMILSSMIALFLGILSSIFVARRFAKRVDVLNKLANDVQAGHLDRRAPRNYSEDEIDRLAEHLNGMLDHIDRLMQAMRYAGDSVAHDLRTPLTRLRTRLETAAVEAGDTPQADVLFAAAGDADELLGTFDSVLRIARLEAGERRELLKPLDPKPILDDLAELYEPACEDAGLTFTFDIADNLLIMADRGLLSQAVSNLVENAIKYAGGGGGTHIHLSAVKSGRGRTRIRVSDDGPGIPMFDRERVKERFVRLDKSRTLPGSGLGLALVDAVAELHNAELNLDDGLGVEAMAAGEDGAADLPGLAVELVFPRVKAAKKPDAVPLKDAAE